jgi:hypothetical protein
MRLCSIPLSAADWEPLFNGKDLTGWKHVGPGSFVVEDGQLKTVGGMGLLYFPARKFGDAPIRVVFRSTKPHDNSGVVIRMPEAPPDPWYGVHNGYEVQIEGSSDDWHYSGSIYSISKVTERLQKPPGEWNTMEIELKGQTTVIHLNGSKVNEYTEGQAVPERKQWYEPVRGPRAASGYFGIQNHGANDTIYFREISVRAR